MVSTNSKDLSKDLRQNSPKDLQESRSALKDSWSQLASAIEGEFGQAPSRVLLIPGAALAIGLLAGLAVKRSLSRRRPAVDESPR